MNDIIDLLTRVDPDAIGMDVKTVLYADAEVRAKATTAIDLVDEGLLAVLECGGHVSFVVLDWAGTEGVTEGAPVVRQLVFSGCGPSGEHRELRHTWWGEDGYVHLPQGGLIADAFVKLERWFDCGEGA